MISVFFRLSRFLAGILAVLTISAAEIPQDFSTGSPMIALDLQWCYKPLPPLQTMLRTLNAAHALGYNALVPEFGPDSLWSAPLPERHREMRAFLKACAEKRMLVIPKLNCLGHTDRGFRWPAPLGDGLDFGEEANYTALEEELAAWQKELAAAGLPMPYFHFGMDEASECLKNNTEKYHESAELLLGRHLERIAALCRKYRTRGIIYHDMLIGGTEKIFWRDSVTIHADAFKSWPVREKLSRDLILNYWNYEPFHRYRTIENVHAEGFQILFTPWGAESCRTMAKNARLYGIGVCGSTWVDFTPVKVGSPLPRNSIYTYGWVLDALSAIPGYFSDRVALERRREPDHGSAWIAAFFPPPETNGRAEPLSPGGEPGPVVRCHGIPFDLSEPLKFGAEPTADFDRNWAELLENAPKPLRVTAADQTLVSIDTVNRPAKFNQRILYTAAYGRETGMDVYSREFRYQDGTEFCDNDWGVGHSLIPRNGFVISGWGEACYDRIPAPPPNSRVELRDADGRVLTPAPEWFVHHPGERELPVRRSVKKLHLLHHSALEGGIDAPCLAELTLKDRQNRIIGVKKVYYGTMLAAERDHLLVGGDDPGIWNVRADRDGVLYGYTWELPETAEVETLTVKLTPVGERLGYVIAGIATE